MHAITVRLITVQFRLFTCKQNAILQSNTNIFSKIMMVENLYILVPTKAIAGKTKFVVSCLHVKGLNLHIRKCQARWNLKLNHLKMFTVHTTLAVIGPKMT